MVNSARLAIWGEEACGRVHEATLEVLVEVGIDVRYAGDRGLRPRRRAGRRHPRRDPAPLVEAAMALARPLLAARRRHRAAGPRRAPHLLRHRVDLLYICDPGRTSASCAQGRRRGRLPCERPPNRLRHEHGPARGRPRPWTTSPRSTMLRTRKPLCGAARRPRHRLMKRCAAAGEADSFGIYASAGPP